MAAEMTYGGASSSSRQWKYDAFLSFFSQDTRESFTNHLFHELVQNGINTFRDDDELQRWEDSSLKLKAAIEGCRIAIIVLSTNYVSSIWCLDELTRIMESKKDGLIEKVLPVFYKVDPSDLKYLRNTSAKAFMRHEVRFKDEMGKVEKWRAALTEAANLSGWVVDNGDETKLIMKIVEEVLAIVNQTHLHAAAYPTGLDSHIERIGYMVNDGLDVVRIIGIYGSGGIGKTTIAKAIFNVMLENFQGSSFLSNVREVSTQQKGLALLHKQLLSDVLKIKDTIDIDNEDEGINIIKERLYYKRVLIVLDDVDEVKQFHKLVGSHGYFGQGSRIILTTRDEQLLNTLEVDEKYKYKVETMKQNESLQLFCCHAFRQNHPLEGYAELSYDVINYAGGLPLALVVLGSLLYKKSQVEWKSELKKLKEIPHSRMLEKLEISYNLLDDSIRMIFLDISCFFVGKEKDIAIKILDGCGMAGEAGIKLLTERSLVTINEDNRICMHSLIRDMGREIVREQSPTEPGERSRLWGHNDVLDVLTNLTGTDAVEGLQLQGKEFDAVEDLQLKRKGFSPLKIEGFSKMHNLRLLEVDCPKSNINIIWENTLQEQVFCFRNLVWVSWKEFPFKYIPNNFHLGNLVILDMQKSELQEVWKGTKNLIKLKDLNLSNSPYLISTPDFSELPNLEKLILNGCKSLVEVHESIGSLKKLVNLDLGNCNILKNLPSGISALASLETLDISHCSTLSKLPTGVSFCSKLETLSVSNCPRLKSLPLLPSSLRSLYASSCSMLKRLPTLSNLKHLMMLDLSCCEKLTEIEGLESLKSATTIRLNECVNLKKSVKKRIFEEICKDLRNNPELCKIFLGGNEVPEWFGFQSESSLPLSCEVTRLPNKEIQGLIICIVCSHTTREEWCFDNLFKVVVAVFIESMDSTWSHRSEISLDRKGMTTYVIKIPNCVWKSIAAYGDTIKVSVDGGSHYDVISGKVKKIGVKKIGVHFIYASQHENVSDEENPEACLSIHRFGFLRPCGRFFRSQCNGEGGSKQQEAEGIVEGVEAAKTLDMEHRAAKVECSYKNMRDVKCCAVLQFEKCDPQLTITVATLDEAKLIGKIVEHVLSITNQTHLHVAEYPIELDSHIERTTCLLNDGMDVRTIGICGLGGIGKTTIAKAIFNVMFTKFEGSSFLANVRDASNQQKGLALLQKQLLSDVLKEKYIDLDNEDQGIIIIKERLQYKKVLIVLDDVDEMEQFDKLVGGCFGPGSRIILTTRDEHLLNVLKVDEKYMVQTLDQNKALQLFSRYAFRQDHPLEGFEQLSNDDKDIAIKILDDCGLPGEAGIKLLMEREIVRRQSPENSEDRSRLWDQDDVLDVLRNLRDGVFFFRNLVWVCWKEFPFEYIPNHFHLRNLVILDMQESKLKEVWKETRNLTKLKELNLSKSPYLKRTPDFSKLSNLEKLILNGCKSLVKVHKTIGLLKKLVYLDLVDCSDLRNLPSRISKLALLETLDVSCCSNLSNLPSGISFCSKLETLNMWNCPRLKSLPMLPSSLRSLYASCCSKLRRIPNLSNLKYLMKLDLSCIEKLTEIGGLDGLKSATTIKLNECVNLKTSVKKRIFQEISKDIGNTEVCKIIMGGNEVPEWFGFQSESPSLSCEVT
ncbi:disease resistance protein RUN1-like [Macadamia integrifolia]|uniref:disease resistance protein RUN1-like n=1 Tax=Macadamia integrifolia TaxID=60698 RepID=UPI001C4FCC3E|nr:disease resistance protein RUN1-like [Macadamia integrifolia]